MSGTTFGTCHFVTIDAAMNYYREQGFDDAAIVVEKLSAKEIAIGRPDPLPNHRIWLNEDGRYMFTQDTA